MIWFLIASVTLTRCRMQELGLRNESSVAARSCGSSICRALRSNSSTADCTSGDADPICCALNTILIGYTPYAGEIAGRPNGVLVSDRPGKAVAYAIFHLQPRGTIFVKPNDPVYRGLIVGENTRPDDMMVNITKEKKQTNIRAANTASACSR